MSNHARTVTLVVLGVSGVGKSSVAAELVARTGWEFVEGDDLHPEGNRRKMAAGHPLDDDDRRPWLHRVAAWIGELEAAGRSGVVTCSALKRSYRDLLRDGHPSVRFVHLLAPPELIAQRVTARQGHYMPPSLLDSQLATLEDLQPDEPGTCVDTTGDPPTVAELALRELGLDGESRAATGGGPP
ncbi:MAG: gluconokinase [Pseudonocardia sp.]